MKMKYYYDNEILAESLENSAGIS